jgi:PAS domain S-box-containing protein
MSEVHTPERARQEPRQTEVQLCTITDSIRQSIVVLAPDGTTLYVNRTVLDKTGLTIGDLNGEGFFARAFHPDDVERVRGERAAGLLKGLPFDLQMRVRLKTGQYRWQLAQYNPHKDEHGRIVRWYATATDVEDLKKAEDLRLEERVNERTRIARELHDTLLQSFQGLLLKFSAVKWLIRDRPGEAEKQLERMIEQARQAITEGRDAVQGLRSSTMISNDLARDIKTVGEGLGSDAGSPEFFVSVEGKSQDLAPLVRDEIYRIASEALRNAFRHGGARRIEVDIDYDNREFRLRVRDDGRGIDPKVLEAGARAGHHGMPGMHERAKIAGGKLTVRSKVDSGTEIELTIPEALAYVNASLATEAKARGQVC